MSIKDLRPQKELQKKQETTEARAFCFNCRRAKKVCICKMIVPQKNQVRIGILQHPNEKKKAFSTALASHLSLENSFLINSLEFDDQTMLHNELEKFEHNEIGLLFPSKEAKNLEIAPKNLKLLLMIDGTWSEAKKMIQHSETLKTIPQYQLIPKEKSRFVLRKEPDAQFLCTLEAIVYSLRIVENDSKAYEKLLEMLDQMQDFQASFQNENPRHKKHFENKKVMARIKELRKLLYSQNLEGIDFSEWKKELEELEKNLKSLQKNQPK
ncbi:MAG: DTW domain-containing protein [Flavobacteriales bacterium]|jgi:DTW domain-containing protein YfiP|nr:DTW domain-containing protein [Flavobacteriales bacterium]